jgi:hypothetical protein
MRSVLTPQLLYAVVEIELPPLDHICGPDCPCWERAVTPRHNEERDGDRH